MGFVSTRIASSNFVGPLDGTATSASFASTASYLIGSIESASYAATASYAYTASYLNTDATASYALTASYVANASSFPYTGSAEITGSLLVIGDVTATNFIGTASLATTASYVVSSSYATSASLAESSSVAVSSSYAASASVAETASFIRTLNQDVYQTGSWEMLGNLTVRGTASFQYTTASSTLVNQNTITVIGSGSVLPQAGLIAADTASVYTSGSWLWDFPRQVWFTTASISASRFVGTASLADSASVATSASYAASLTGSLRQNLTLSGSILISGSLLVNGVAPGAGGGATVTITGSAPSGSKDSGSLWWNENDGNLYIQVTSPTGSTYVPATNTVAGGNYGATLVAARTGSTWTINHNLGTRTPLVIVYSGSSVMIPATIDSLDANNTRITFSGSVTGTAVLSTGIGNATAALATTASFATSASLSTSASIATRTNRVTPTGWQLYSTDTDFWNAGSQNMWAFTGQYVMLSGSAVTFTVPAGFSNTKVLFTLYNWGDAGSSTNAAGSLRYAISGSLVGGLATGIAMASWSNPTGTSFTARWNSTSTYQLTGVTPGTYSIRFAAGRESESGTVTALTTWGTTAKVEVFIQP